MKQIRLSLIVGFLSWAFALSGQNYGINIRPVCWTTAGGVDSTVYAAYMSAAATTRPTHIHYFVPILGTNRVAPVTISGGSIRAGSCTDKQLLLDNDTLLVNITNLVNNSDTVIVRLDNIINQTVNVNVKLDSLAYLLDSLLNLSKQTQTCNCTYTLDLANHSYSIQNNSQYPVWSFERVITRNCGIGPEIVARIPGSVTNTNVNSRTSVGYNNSGNSLQNGGYLDSMRVHTKNPDLTFWIYLSPMKVAEKYPLLLTNGLDTSRLRFNSSQVSLMNSAIQTVVNYAASQFALLQNPVLPPPTMTFVSQVLSNGNFNMRWYVTHNPSGFYVAVNPAASNRRIIFHTTASGATTSIDASFSSGASELTTQQYTLPCGTIIYTTYTASTYTPNNDWFQMPLTSPATPSLVGQLGAGTCTQPCPTTKECVTICDTVMVRIVDQAGGSGSGASNTCAVQNIAEFPVTASGSSVALAQNYYHAVTIAVTSGTVSITLINAGDLQTRTFSAGQTFSVKAADCALIKTGFGINATAGTAIVSTIR